MVLFIIFIVLVYLQGVQFVLFKLIKSKVQIQILGQLIVSIGRAYSGLMSTNKSESHLGKDLVNVLFLLLQRPGFKYVPPTLLNLLINMTRN